MLRIFERAIESLEEGLAAFLATLKRVRVDMNEAISDFNEDFTRTHEVDSVPVTSMSRDAPVLLPVSSKKPNLAKMSLKKLRAYADELGVEYHHNHKEESLRELIEGVE